MNPLFPQTLHMLGHHLVILTSQRQLSERVPKDKATFDLVFTDYMGLFALRDSKHFPLYKVSLCYPSIPPGTLVPPPPSVSY